MPTDYTRPCGAGVVDGGPECGATPTRPYICGPRCRAHVPLPVNPIPDPERVYRPRWATTPNASWAAVDARAVASGKRASDPETRLAARALVNAQKARDARLRSAQHPDVPPRLPDE